MIPGGSLALGSLGGSGEQLGLLMCHGVDARGAVVPPA